MLKIKDELLLRTMKYVLGKSSVEPFHLIYEIKSIFA